MRALVAAACVAVNPVPRVLWAHLSVEDKAIVGASGLMMLASSRVVLAAGGIGGLFDEATNPLGCFGQGLALGARAGAALADLDDPVPPDRARDEFFRNGPGAELAPRDVVARAIWAVC